MKLRFKHQKFQAEAAAAVCDVFAGQPFHAPTYMIDSGTRRDFDGAVRSAGDQVGMFGRNEFTGFNNAPSPLVMIRFLSISARCKGWSK